MWRASSSLRAAMRSAMAWIDPMAAAVATAKALRARVTDAPVRGPYEPRSRFSAWTLVAPLRTLSLDAGGHRVCARVLRPGRDGPGRGLPERRRRQGAGRRDAEIG